VQHEGVEVRAVGPYDGSQLVVYANLRKEVGVGEWLEHGAVQLSCEIDITRAVIAEADGVGVPAAAGLKLSSRPASSIAVHCETDGQATARREYAVAPVAVAVKVPANTESEAAKPASARRTLIGPKLLIATVLTGPHEQELRCTADG
jgi:hypothetical protein